MMSKKRSDYYIQSIKRAIQILNSFTLKEKELSITELSKRLNLHKSTVHRILVTLEDEALVEKNNINQKYHLAIKLLELGNIVKEQMEISTYTYPIMKELVQKVEESVYLNIIMDKKKVIIEKCESSHDLRRVIHLGKSSPLYRGSSGKVLLAFLSDEEIDEILQKEKLIPLTPNTITDPIKLKQKLKEIRLKKYAISLEETHIGTNSVAVPIFDYSGKCVASLGISGPSNRFTKQKILQFVPLVKETAKKISFSSGYQGIY